MYKDISEVMNDKELLVSLVEAETPEAFGQILENSGITLDGLSVEEAFRLFKDQEAKELSQEELESASGGIAFLTGLAAVGTFVAGYAVVRTIGSYAYQQYKSWKKNR